MLTLGVSVRIELNSTIGYPGGVRIRDTIVSPLPEGVTGFLSESMNYRISILKEEKG